MAVNPKLVSKPKGHCHLLAYGKAPEKDFFKKIFSFHFNFLFVNSHYKIDRQIIVSKSNKPNRIREKC